MKRLISVSLAASMLLLGMIHSGTVQANSAEKNMTITRGRTVTPEEQSIISSAAIKVLRHIAQARADIHEKNLIRAQNELKQTHPLFEIIKATEPTEKIKDRIWVAKTHLSYESTETVMNDLIPIYASLDDIEGLVPVEKTREHINNAKKHLEKGNKKGAGEELKLADESLLYAEIDLPLGNTERHIINAQRFLRKKEAQEADAALKSAENGVQFISVMDSLPVVQAKKSLWQASKKFAEGDLAGAKRDLEEAKTYLEKAIKSGDAKTSTEAEKLMKDTEAVEGKVDNGAKETEQDINNLYKRAKSLMLSAVDLFQAGGNESGESLEKAMGN
jgi:TPR repeat protein